jgi:gas vesicle protein
MDRLNLPPLPETPKLDLDKVKDVVEQIKDKVEDVVQDVVEDLKDKVEDVVEDLQKAPAVEALKLRILKEVKACCLIA